MTGVLAFVITSAFAQSRTVTGTVTDPATGESLPGVNVVVKGTTNGTITDIDGKYSLEVPSEGGTLIFSFVGMETKEVVIGTQSVIDVALGTDVTELQEVVVTALGISREKASLGYAVAKVSDDLLENRPEADLGRILRGKAPGVDISQTSGLSGSGTNIIIRGYSSINGSNQPLFVVDGVPFNSDTNSDRGFAQGGATASSRFLDLDPNNIKDVNILKGLSATGLYGEAGRNGVIVITTKTGSGGAAKKGSEISFSQSVSFADVANVPIYQDSYGNGFSGDFGWYYSNWGPHFDTRGSNGIDDLGQIGHPYDQAQYRDDFPEFIGQRYDYKPYRSVENFFKTGKIT
ncbi:MAG: carboxypeptidase-like regulatory domain-containing protein, partial [Cyclobacteriaceae bacterium]|nr:carboxypeptidase-like regulatory domain-containing protein [Cyclobacteriaceae bacterium]